MEMKMEMKKLLRRLDVFGKARREFNEKKCEDTSNSATKDFNIVRIDGKDYIVYGSVVVSRSVDTDLLERMNELRSKHIDAQLRKL